MDNIYFVNKRAQSKYGATSSNCLNFCQISGNERRHWYLQTRALQNRGGALSYMVRRENWWYATDNFGQERF